MNTNKQVLALLFDFVDAAGLSEVAGGHDAIEASLPPLWAHLERIGNDAELARVSDVDLADAAVDYENYPFLARLHASINDFLTLTLQPEMLRWLERFYASPEPPALEPLRAMVVECAAYDEDPVRRAVARVALFEAIRLNLLIIRHWHPELAEVGVTPEDLSVHAEMTLDIWMAGTSAVPSNVRPLHVLVAAAMEGLQQHAEQLKATLCQMKIEHFDHLARHARLDAYLSQLDTRDALLIRNSYATELEERPLNIDMLQSRHPLVLGDVSRNALDQRLGRARERFAREGKDSLRRSSRGKAFIDVVREASGRDDGKKATK